MTWPKWAYMDHWVTETPQGPKPPSFNRAYMDRYVRQLSALGFTGFDTFFFYLPMLSGMYGSVAAFERFLQDNGFDKISGIFSAYPYSTRFTAPHVRETHDRIVAGIVGYLPTWRQMTSGSGATAAGLSVLPVSLGIVTASTLGGIYISRTGRYRELPVIASLMMAVGLWVLSGMRATTDLWVVVLAMFGFGLGLGLAIQTWMLVVQTSVPLEQVGTAIGTNRFLSQVGSSIGLAVVGSVFTARLVGLLATRAPGVPGLSLDALSPAAVAVLSPESRAIVVSVYEDALSPVYAALAPVVLVIAVLSLFLTHRSLATTVAPIAGAAESA